MTKILLITGPSGAGKTTVCKELLAKADGAWVYINQDDIRQMVKAGYASADDYEKNWTNETKKQWEVSIPVCADIARRYQAAGINCLVDFFAPPKEFKIWQKCLEGIEYQLVVLLPSEAAAVKRNATRDWRGKLKEDKVKQNHRQFSDGRYKDAVILDTTDLEPSKTVTKILSISETTPAPWV